MNDLSIRDNSLQPIQIREEVPFVPAPPVLIDPVIANPVPLPIEGEENRPVEDETTSRSSRGYLRELWKKVVMLLGVDEAEQEDRLAEAKKMEQQVQMIGIRPVLEKPKSNAVGGANHLLSALKKASEVSAIQRIDSVNDSVEVEAPTKRKYSEDGDALIEFAPEMKKQRLDETAIEKETIEVNKLMVENRQKASANLSESILHEGEEKKRLWKQYLDLKAEAEKKAKQSKILSWTSIGTLVISGALVIAGIIAAIFTGGLGSIFAAFAIAGGVAGISTGGTQIASSVVGYQGNLINGEAFVMKEKQGLKKEQIVSALQSLESNDNSITQLWANLAQILRNMPTDMLR